MQQVVTTRLLSGAGGGGPLQFSEPRYCLLLAEDAPPALRIAQVSASHKDGVRVRYSIRAGNRDGLFTIDQHTGLITLAAPLDYELHAKHELVVAAEASGRTAHAIVRVTVVDVNDNEPQFLEKDLQVTVEEEDDEHLPATIAKRQYQLTQVANSIKDGNSQRYRQTVSANTSDRQYQRQYYLTIMAGNTRFTLSVVLSFQALNRDPPLGRDIWRVKVQVRDGQRVSPSLAAVSRASRRPRVTHGQYGITPQDPDTPAKTPSLMTERPTVLVQSRYIQSQDPELAGQDQYILWQDPSSEGGRYFLAQDPLMPSEVTLTEGKVSEVKHTEEKFKLYERQNTRERKGQRTAWRAEDTRRYLVHDRGDVHERKYSKRSGRTEDITKSKVPRKKSEFIQKRRTLERKRILRDKNHRNTKQEMCASTESEICRGRKTGGAGTKRLELPNISSRTSYGSQTRSRKVHQKLTILAARQDRGELPELTRVVFGDQPSEETSTEGAARRPRPAKLKFMTRRKYRRVSVQRQLLSFKGNPEIQPVKQVARDYVGMARNELSSDLEPGLRYFVSEVLPFTTKFPLEDKEGHFLSPRASEFTGASALKKESDSPSGSSGVVAEDTETTRESRDGTDSLDGSGSMAVEDSITIEEGNSNLETTGAAISKREVNPLTVKKQQKKLSENTRYVRRFGPDGGGCWDYGAFTANAEESRKRMQQYLKEMRSDQVHVAETVVTVVVKDINDNAPVFPNVTIYGEVQENGPIDLSAGVVWAWDADDQQEGTNAHLTYSIEKNVVDERSGQAIFAVNPETGLVRTAVCCLDRETTPEYHIQVVATDGGGLKGTGTVVVRLADVNDNSPRLTRDLWQVEMDETWGHGAPSNDTLLQVSTADHDTSNYFFYRVVEESGWGWQHFGMRTEGTVGQLFARQTLDFEDAAHRRGFRFMIQVTDRGRGGWSDARHTDTAWVEVRLRDLNDNPPQFRRPHVHITVREDTAPGTLLAALPATDPDMMKQQGVEYRVEGGWGALSVDGIGGVRLWRALDREAPGGEEGVARVVAVDEGGRPSSLSSTATLTITVTDVNDCPPRLLPPTLLHVTEGTPASLLGLLTATDDDVWALAHGPPFNFTLAPSNPAHVLNTLSIKYDSSTDSGRGGAEVWTLGPVDREEHRQLTAEVVVADAGGLAATQPVTVIIDDVNDNPMKPAAKTVYLWKTQGGGADAALGRVYVEDPDDWDLQDKSFSWAGPPHPLFTLQVNTGEIFASTQLREGRYELHFSVSDRVWGQRDVAAKVTAVVKYLSPEALAHAVPVTLTPTTPSALAASWTPTRGGGGLGTLTEAVMQAVGREADAVEIVSVYGLPEQSITLDPAFQRSSLSDASISSFAPAPAPPPLACVWLSVRQKGGSFMDPVKLHGLLALHLQQVEKVMNLRVALEDMHIVEGKNGEATSGTSVSSPADNMDPHNPSSVASLASMALPLQVVDTNQTSLVTPRLTRAQNCQAQTAGYVDDACTPTSCLNGGRCVRTDLGNR
ncbi:uncharacterized protein [Panulirus ornatus]|uniref:uncharacterized protein n=1 Tax=Panulirus ornatus TaxID=150431 RepID=UPI003A858850